MFLWIGKRRSRLYLQLTYTCSLVAMCLGQRPTLHAHATSFVVLEIEPTQSRTRASDDGFVHVAHRFFAASSALFDILHAILLQIYVPENRNPSEKLSIDSSLVGTILNIEERLTTWNENLPQYLALPETGTQQTNSTSVRPAHFLRQRYVPEISVCQHV